MATSAERKASVSKSARLSTSMMATISCPRDFAMDSIILPILPYPMSAIFIREEFTDEQIYTFVGRKTNI